jgi:hypothetical protein
MDDLVGENPRVDEGEPGGAGQDRSSTTSDVGAAEEKKGK